MDTPWVSLGWVEEDDLELEDRGWRLVFVDWMGEEERSMVGVGVGWGGCGGGRRWSVSLFSGL